MFIYLLINIPNITIPNNTVFMNISPYGSKFTSLTAVNLDNGHAGGVICTSSDGSVQTSGDSSNIIAANTSVAISGVVPLAI